MNKKILILPLLLIFVFPASAATIHGKIYDWYTLEPMKNVIVEVNSTPSQCMVAKSATYSFDLPPGNYLIQARYYENNVLTLYTEENITIIEEGDYVLDLIMLPAVDEEIMDIPDVEINENHEEIWIYLFFGIVSGIIVMLFFFKRKKRVKEVVDYGELPEDLKEVISIIQQNGGRITQKELRKRLSLSEAKISLMITDLENRGLVTKIKKGRGNVIILTNDRKL